MFLPPGFGERSVMTTLGRMVYYTAVGEPWSDTAESLIGGNLRSELSKRDVTESSDKALVFLHAFGGGSSAYEWSKVYPAFATEYRILAPDLIGWGRSEHPARNYQIDDYIKIIIEFIEKTCSGPIPVIASGLTAAFTIRAAIARPELFKSLFLTTAAGLNDFGKSYSNSFSAQIINIPILNGLLYRTGVANSFGIRSYLEQRQFARSERVYSEIVEAYLQSAERPNAEYAALAFVRGDLSFDLSLYINQLTVPTALVWGQKSEYTGPEVGRRLAEMNPQAVRIFYHSDEFGFTPQLELPAVTIGLMRKFLPLLED